VKLPLHIVSVAQKYDERFVTNGSNNVSVFVVLMSMVPTTSILALLLASESTASRELSIRRLEISA